MESIVLYYQEFGKINFLGIFLVLMVGLVVVFVFGFVYVYVIFYIFIIYFNFLFIYFFGFSIGYVVGKVGLLGKVWNGCMLLFIVIGLGVIGVYFVWVFWIVVVFEGGFWFFNLSIVWLFVQLIVMEGVWSIFGFMFIGGILYLVWFVEVVIILFGVVMVVSVGRGSKFYCEFCDQWLSVKYFIE